MQIYSRRNAISEETRQLLTQSASQLFVAHSFEAVSIDQIAANAGLTKGAFYHHFKTKTEAFEVSYRAQIQRIVAAIQSSGAELDPTECAVARARSFLQFVLHHHHELISLDKAIAVLGWSTWKKLDTNAFYPLIQEPLEKLQSQGQLQNQPIPLLCDMLHGILFNAVMAMAHSPRPETMLKPSVTLFESFFRSL